MKPQSVALGAELGRHPRHPDALPGGVQVDVVAAFGGQRLDRDREHRVRTEDRDLAGVAMGEG